MGAITSSSGALLPFVPFVLSSMLTRDFVVTRRWDGPDQFEDPSGQIMMLPSDMALVWDKGELGQIYLRDHDMTSMMVAVRTRSIIVQANDETKKTCSGRFIPLRYPRCGQGHWHEYFYGTCFSVLTSPFLCVE